MEKSVANGIYEQTSIDPGFFVLEFLLVFILFTYFIEYFQSFGWHLREKINKFEKKVVKLGVDILR